MNELRPIDLVARAQALAPLITREADEIERTRRLTQPIVSALIDGGLYRALLPKTLGGAEAPIETFMQMLEEIAKADASTAWCLGQCSVCAMIAAYLDADTARKVFAAPNDILAWGSVGGEVQAVPGGYRATGRWEFASGVRQASWLGAHVHIVEADGTRRLGTNGAPVVRTILFPVSSAALHDVWNVVGLKGTGTDSYSVDGLFIPEAFAAPRDEAPGRRETGPLYRLPTMYAYGLGFGAVALGVARATLDAAVALARGKQSFGLNPMRDSTAVQASIGRAEAQLRSARAYLYATAADVWRDLTDRSDELSEQQRLALRLAATWTIHQATAVTDAAYHMAGSTAVLSKYPFERRFRDMHAIAQQLQARDAHYETVGLAILTAKPDASAPPGA
ncbi:acyl-CoA dehydrogenase family protein [Bradyrhizobium sp. LHD-71]|uniref:acyl-CoA dehydrogenase family protein n=1 Tax=Bradyrhizobium sp. LHD-71 TaxID=3072141 RepID=UPI00280C8A95|nr:acyl-CoA dehydrogenase family protein [Bradyrhizobium sp. LHD-71]MDQ8727302.1 acyl-CoA dehydrogenase family protein [Bradyrhizobium sp. LHD-71]